MTTNKPNYDFSGPELCALEAHEVVELLRRKEVAPETLVEASSARIAEVEPKVNAMPTLCEERALSMLKAWQQTGFDPESTGWLGGLPVSIKDLQMVGGVRTTFGTPALADFVPDVTDPLVERIERRGGVVMGKSNTPEMGAGGNTFNPVFGMTRNPWNTACNAGGSSGGAAVSLVTGEVWLAHGSDLAGSLRTPAAYCGVVGMRPTPGRAGGGPSDIAFNTEGVQGPMARSVRDCALFLDAMAGFDPANPISFPAPDSPFQDAVVRAEGKVRIAFSPTLNGFASISRETESVLRQALLAVERNGGVVEEDCPELPGLNHTYRVLRAMMWAAGPGQLPDEIQSRFKQTLTENINYGHNLTVADVYQAHRGRTVIFRKMIAFLEDFDVLACPVVGVPPGPVEEEYPTHMDGELMEDYIEWLRFSYLATTASLPALSVPAGFTEDGLPVGLQLIGRPRGEAELLAVARAVELAVGGPNRPIDPNVKHSL